MLTAESNTYNIENLQPTTVYLLRAKAKNLAGFSDSSNVIYLQTTSPHQVFMTIRPFSPY